MSPTYTINFRREAYRQGIARARRRVITLGAWVAYYGVMGLIIGLYGLNCASLTQRVRQVERQTATLRGSQDMRMQWNVGSAELEQVERFVLNPRRWRDRLARLAEVLPAHVRLTSVTMTPGGASGSAENLVIAGALRGAAGQDRMQDVVGVVTVLREDSSFARGYRSIRLTSSRMLEDVGTAEFTIECR